MSTPELRAEPARPDEPAPAAPISAADRVQTPRLPPLTPAASRGAYWRTVARVAAVLLVVAAVAWWVQRDTTEDTDLLGRLDELSAEFQPALLTASAAQAADYVERTSGFLVSPPELPGLALVGVGYADLSPQSSVPAFRYDGADGVEAVVFVYDYVFLDEIRSSLTLGEAVYASLANDPSVDTRRADDALFVTWRERAVIYTAVTTDEATFERLGSAVPP